MKNNNIKTFLFFTILVMAVLPLTASFYFLDHTLQTSLNLGFNQQVVRALEMGSQNLKTLKNFDPQNEDRYRGQFEEIENLKYVYSNPELVKGSILDSLKIYFGLGLVAALLLSVFLAAILSQRIARSYRVTFDDLIRHKEKIRYLEEISSWQELAKVLAHEIKNPLTPIEVLVTSLSKSYLKKSQTEFQEQLSQTQTMIGEELGHLKNIVNKFSEFSKLPKVQLIEENIVDIIKQHLKALSATFESVEFQFNCDDHLSQLRVKIDSTLFRQVLANIIRNGVEANSGRKVIFDIQLTNKDDSIQLIISNNGTPVPKDIGERIFDPYISGKSGKDNMGLGLAIVKKIIIEHGGEITYVERDGRPSFNISLEKVD